ncbi:uncharacterized protein EAF01_001239 [Botrytis porri]|uniref:uncharacterized protein n=1 Tax=Botrytis porri TaxID=87229 RepID=UPI0018FF9157|nr:uncharacterized protein EAF01_001239 [Botrytis porri]KAF7912218.1 hypothetical protein EAF01_001239 [Botrytis porri]
MEQERLAGLFNRNISEDTISNEEDMLEDFGFSHLSSLADRSKLLGLYKGFWLGDVPVEDIHRWQVEATALHMAHPNPIQTNWYDFGFCTCNDEQEERALGVLYRRLLLGNKLLDDLRGNIQHMFYGLELPTAISPEF